LERICCSISGGGLGLSWVLAALLAVDRLRDSFAGGRVITGPQKTGDKEKGIADSGTINAA